MNWYLGASIIEALGNVWIFGEILRTDVKKNVFFGTQMYASLGRVLQNPPQMRGRVVGLT